MNGEAASYSFLSWLRLGVSTEITRVDGASGSQARAGIPVTLSFAAGQQQRSATLELALHGPGEVAGIDPNVVIRSDPRPGVFDAEADRFPSIEFDEPDLPWRFTPARANAGRPGQAPARPGEGVRLRPWLVLIALSDDEVERFEPAADQRLPEVRVRTTAALPDLAQSWAWAHVQVTALREGESVADILEREPERILSRLLCPRRLAARTAYTAYVVPAFERGRRAGLGEAVDPEGGAVLDALAPAWGPGHTALRLPVYYDWRFQTGPAGDFEHLVRRLRARPVVAGVGRRPMQAGNPGAGLPAAASAPLELEGALTVPGQRPSAEWDAQERARFVAALRDRVNLPARRLAGGERGQVLAPPLYGRWHARRDRLAPLAGPAWFQELNADPRLRVASGAGSEVVRRQQEQLMAGAWAQVEGVLEIDRRLRLAQLARELTSRVRTRHLASLDEDTTLQVARPLLSRISVGPRTPDALLRQGPVVNGVLEGSFRRLSRPLGPIRRLGGRGPQAAPTLLRRLNQGELSPAGRPAVPIGIVASVRGDSQLGGLPRPAPSAATGGLGAGGLQRALSVGLLIAAVVAPGAALLFFSASVTAGFVSALASLAALAGAVAARRDSVARRLRARLRLGIVSPQDVRRAPAARGFEPAAGTRENHTPQPSLRAARAAGETREAVDRLRDALANTLGQIDTPAAPGAVLEPAKLNELRARLLAAVDPEQTVAQSLRGRLRIAPGRTWQPQDPLTPVMAAPAFEQPMYEPLRELSQEWLLPGVGSIPADTTTLLVTNQRFVEAYMAGLNHEMGRELLWREYPTDQRGTYFRQFWDVRGRVAAGPGESLQDIDPMHTWQAGLGSHGSRSLPEGSEHLVLLIRGEVLQRYPNAIVYAHRAQLGAPRRRELSAAPGAERHPVFHGTLGPDLSFFGFDLAPDEVRGSIDPAADQGWFFVLQEQPSEPSFGLDSAAAVLFGRGVAAWDDLSWSHLVADAAELEQLAYVDLDANLPDTRGVAPAGSPALVWHADSGLGASGTQASDIASLTLRKPFRVAKHGSDMLPPPEAAP